QPGGTGVERVPIGGEPAPDVSTSRLTGQALDAAAINWVDTGTFPSGLTRDTPVNRRQRLDIQNRGVEIANDRGISIEDLPSHRQEFKSQQVGIQRFRSGPQGNSIRSLGVAVDHLDTLRGMALALKNGNIQVFNRLAQAWAEQTGSPV